ncbi:hypothetical protein DOTSEDRAFT_75053 [Dothistroma septosporum NZE10]|uniref:Uncharacterized protein n=1 Tax=Dothistroma septosporum (strain NZE10 / CBS 128990) TaxID=675120 RepID=M2YJR4_DOTSN|nr:hypothetical protein DOTSEDRAFT_75053 [Dothistroma septosporum NZE10]
MEEISCFVFQTDVRLQANADEWQSWGALELGSRQDGPLRPESDHIILFRSPKGYIQDITSYVEFGSRDGHLTVSLAYNAAAAAATPELGFDIVFSGSSDSDAAFEGAVERAVQNSRTRQDWRGNFVCAKKQNLSVVKQGPTRMPERAQNFLNIDPWTILGNGEHVDSVAQLSSRVLKDLIMAAMPPPATDLFYGGQFETPDSQLSDLITALGHYHENIQSHLHPRSIFGQHQHFLEIAAIHIMVRDVRSQDWLNDMQKSHTIDKSEKLFNLLNSNDINAARDNYGNPSFDVHDVVGNYREALQQCYLASYIQSRPAWDEVARAPNESYKAIVDYLRTDQFLIHLLPTLIDTVEHKYTVPFKERMDILGDKLGFLARMTGLATGNTPPSTEINDIIAKLIAAANQSGLIKGTMVERFSLDDMDARMINSPYAALPGVFQLLLSAFDGRAANIMQAYATPLGLYVPWLPGWHGFGP